MKAAVLTDFGKIDYTDVPEPKPASGEALVKVVYSGVCGSDVHVFQGHHPSAHPPLIMGHEFSGTIEEIGSDNVKGLRAGDPVAVQPFYSCGVCEMCMSGRDNVCAGIRIFGIHIDGSFAEYIKAPVKRIFPLENGLDFRLAALVEPLAVAVHDVRSSGLKIGESVLIIGGGTIGLLIAEVARISGASDILVTELNPYKKALLAERGFAVEDPTEGDVMEKVRQRTRGKGFHKVFEVSGTKSGTELMIRAAASGGTAVVVGIPTEAYPMDTDTVFKRELTVRGVRIHAPHNYKAALELAYNPEIKTVLTRLITREYPLSELDKAIDLAMTSSTVSKLVIKNPE